MSDEYKTVRLRHQLPGFSPGEQVPYPRAVANRLVEDLYAESIPEGNELTAEDEASESEWGKRTRLNTAMGGRGKNYTTK
jgi:hypothetical protein